MHFCRTKLTIDRIQSTFVVRSWYVPTEWPAQRAIDQQRLTDWNIGLTNGPVSRSLIHRSQESLCYRNRGL